MAITSATGGIITNYTSSTNNFTSHTFLTSGQLQVTGSDTVALLIVGGGGGGSLGGGGESTATNRGNGGGAGGYVSRSFSLTAGVWNISVGNGGLGGIPFSNATTGETSSFGTSATALVSSSFSMYAPATASTALVSSSYVDKAFFVLTGSVVGKFFLTASTTQTDVAPIYYVTTGSTATLTMANIAAKINTLTSTFKIIASGSAATLQLTASVPGTGSNTFSYTSASITQPFEGGLQPVGDSSFFQLTGSIVGQFYVTGSSTQVDTPPIYYVTTGSTATLTMANIAAKINTLSSSFNIKASGSAASLQLTASVSVLGNTFTYVSASITQPFAGGTYLTGSYGGFGGQPTSGNGSSGGGSYPTGGADIFSDSGSNGGTQQGKSGAGGGGAANSGSDAYFVFNDPFTIYNGGNGGTGLSNNLRNGTGSFFAAGGGGGGWMNVGPGGGGTGGSSIGGNGGSGVQGAGGVGAANTGAGGGGGALSDQSSNWGNGGDGGSGIVVIRYKTN